MRGLVRMLCLWLFLWGSGAGLWPGDASGEEAVQGNAERLLKHIEHLTVRVEQAVRQERWEEARAHYAELAEAVVALTRRLPVSVEGLHAVLAAVLEGKRAFARVQPDPEAMLRDALRVRLAADALLHRQQPLWKEYRAEVETQLRQLRSGAVSGNNWLQAYRRLAEIYTIVRPAVVIQQPPEDVEALDSLIRALDQSAPHVDRAVVWEFHNRMARLFELAHAASASPWMGPSSIYAVVAVMAVVVFTVLGYVAWYRYRLERRP
ncbi:hypothetical protein JCM14720_15060 [Calditerricola yamamurae]